MKKNLIVMILALPVFSEDTVDESTVCDVEMLNCVQADIVYDGSGEIVEVMNAGMDGKTKCLQAKTALHFINNKDCTRIYESWKCVDKGFVEVMCSVITKSAICDTEIGDCVQADIVYDGSGDIVEVMNAGMDGKTKCLQAKTALHFINNKDCTRIYESWKCVDKGFVEVMC